VAKAHLLVTLILTIGCLPTYAAPAQPSPSPNLDPDRVRTIVERNAKELGARAVLFGIWKDDREILTMALGSSTTTVPAATRMHYRIGGIAETFMSTLLLILVERGQEHGKAPIGLDDRISRWFPELLGADQVTVRMLVSNTAGYIDYVAVDDFLELQLADPFRTFSDEELIQYSVRDGKMNFRPGTSQQYSHTDNVILGQVIQRATGKSMKELYDTYLFGPLGLNDTQFPVDQNIQVPVLHAFTKERGRYEDCTYWNPFWGSTPGLPTSTIHDLGKWGPVLGTGRLISPAHFTEQIAPSSVGKGRNRRDLYFAWGFAVANGWLIQNPSINGYSGAFGYNMATGVTIVVATTRSEKSVTDAAAIAILKEVVRHVTPTATINF
jgi:D-alanyl-D-alanine carboxypeptidase